MLSTRDVLLVELRAVPCGASDERWRERLNNGVTVWSPGLLVGVRRRFLDQLEWSDDPVRSTVRRSAHHDERHSARIVRPPARYRESCFAQQASVRGHPLCAAALNSVAPAESDRRSRTRHGWSYGPLVRPTRSARMHIGRSGTLHGARRATLSAISGLAQDGSPPEATNSGACPTILA